MLVSARMLPCHCDAVPIVAELPTCQYTFLACAPLISTTLPAVVSDGARLEDEGRVRIAAAVERQVAGDADRRRACSRRRRLGGAAEIGDDRVRRRARKAGERVVRGRQIDLLLHRDRVVEMLHAGDHAGREAGDRAPRADADVGVDDAERDAGDRGAGHDAVRRRRAEIDERCGARLR